MKALGEVGGGDRRKDEGALPDFESVYRHSPVALCLLDAQQRVLRINESMARLARAEPPEAVGRRFSELVGLTRHSQQSLAQVFRTGQAPLDCELVVRLGAGREETRTWLASYAPILVPNGEVIVACAIRDVSEGVEQELIRERDRLRSLTADVLRAREANLRTLSRELHDGVGQQLAVLGMHIGELGSPDGGPSKDLSEGLRKAQEEISKISLEVSALARRLYPSVLHDLGLAAAIEDLCRKQGAHIETSLEPVDKDELGADASLNLYRITQEWLESIQQQPEGANQAVSVSLHRRGDEILLILDRDGPGVESDRTDEQAGRRGLLAQERVQQLNGEIRIAAQEGKNAKTKWEVRIPIQGGRSP